MAKKNPAAVALGKLGGRARIDSMTDEELSEHQRKAVKSRWARMSPKERRAATAKARAARRKK